MMTSKFVTAAALAAALAVPGSAQSASELLQKGIYSQETAGDLDGAIQIYRQIVGSAPAQHEITAEAQYRLAQTLVRKGDLTGAAIEFQKLARDYSEYQALISRMAASPQLRLNVTSPTLTPPPLSAEFDSNRPVIVSGSVTQLQWMNPRAWISVKDGAGTDWRIAVASPNAMLRQQWTRDSVRLGDQITVNGSLAKDGTKTAAAVTVDASNGKRLFDSASVAEATPAEQDRLKVQLTQQALQQQGERLRQQIEARVGTDPNAYIIRPNDVLSVEVFGQPRFTDQVAVRPNGKITMPDIGEIQASGLTPNQLRDQIKVAYAGQITNPVVSVTVTQASGQQQSVR